MNLAVACRRAGTLGLMLGSIVAGLLLLELGCRLMNGPKALLDWHNLVLTSRIAERNVAAREQKASYVYDPTLGFLNAPGFEAPNLSFDARGLRRMPPLSLGAAAEPPILVTGDSYTKGDEVTDFEAWPARLQQLVGRRTINAGVGAFGLDQIVLNTERLVSSEKPGLVIVGFIVDDLRRAEMSRMWGREKPYFEFAGSGLVLRNVPVPETPDPRQTLSPLQAVLGWSVLLDTVLDRLRLRNEWHMDHVRALPSGTGERLACPLMHRLAALKLPTLVVAQYLPTGWEDAALGAEEHRAARVVLKCAEQAGLGALDLHDVMGAAVKQEGRAAIYYEWHPNAHGQLITARAVAGEIATLRSAAE